MKRIIAAVIVSIILGLGLGTWSSLNNASACINSPGCVDQNKQPKGKLTTFKQGFPAAYKTTVKFEPTNSDQNSANYVGYAQASATTQKVNAILAAINVLFWLPIVFYLLKFIPLSRTSTKSPSSIKDQ